MKLLKLGKNKAHGTIEGSEGAPVSHGFKGLTRMLCFGLFLLRLRVCSLQFFDDLKRNLIPVGFASCSLRGFFDKGSCLLLFS